MSMELHEARLRANPAYKAVPQNRLSAEDRSVLAVDPENYGVLMPRSGSDLAPMAIDRDTALIFLTLQEPGPPPDFVFTAGGTTGERALSRLLLDRILEVEGPTGYVSGADACALIGVAPIESESPVMRLSIEALQHASAWPAADVRTLAQRLYAYNRRPLTPALRRHFSDGVSALEMLGIADASAVRAALDTYWMQQEQTEGWTVYAARRAASGGGARPCKLYLGIAFEELPHRLAAIVDALGRSEAIQFKIGAGLSGLLRPDKLVAYFPGKDGLLGAAQSLLPALDGAATHAVPFSAGIDAGGRLSWGSDPPPGRLGERVSWRQWICGRCAEALVMARGHETDGLPAWRFALERLRLEGVDAQTFMPTASWSGDI